MKVSNKINLLTLLGCVCISMPGNSQTPQSITEKLNESGNITVYHCDELEQRIAPIESTDDKKIDPIEAPRTQLKKTHGYRVLVFTDNNVKTARNEANAVAKKVASVFPEFPVYVTFNTPNWRVKVGDFRTKDEAIAAVKEIKKRLADIGKEARVVQDGINLSDK